MAEIKELLKPNRAKLNAFLFTVFLQVAIIVASLIFTFSIFKRFYYMELELDLFGDFRNVLEILYSYPNPYDTGFVHVNLSYPPFALLFFLPCLLLYYILGHEYWVMGLTLILFMLIPMWGITWVGYKSFEKKAAPLTLAALYLTFAFCFLFCRANVLIYSFLLVLIFLRYYKSQKKWQREVSLLALAAASAIKIYPLVFLLLLLIELRIWDVVKTALYFLVLFFLPFLFFEGGFANIYFFIRNMNVFSDSFNSFSAIKCDNYSSVTLIQSIFYLFTGNIPADVIPTVNLAFLAVFLISVVLFSFVLQEKWKVLTLLALAVIYVPLVSIIYTQVFLLPAFIAFLCSGRPKKKDIVYLILFLLILMPVNRLFIAYDPNTGVPINYPWFYNNPDAPFAEGWTPIENPINTFIMVFAMLALYLLLATDAVWSFVKKVRTKGFLPACRSIIFGRKRAKAAFEESKK